LSVNLDWRANQCCDLVQTLSVKRLADRDIPACNLSAAVYEDALLELCRMAGIPTPKIKEFGASTFDIVNRGAVPPI
jgi:hypothetical protein